MDYATPITKKKEYISSDQIMFYYVGDFSPAYGKKVLNITTVARI